MFQRPRQNNPAATVATATLAEAEAEPREFDRKEFLEALCQAEEIAQAQGKSILDLLEHVAQQLRFSLRVPTTE